MTVSYLRYELEDGYIHNWLVAGPQRVPASQPDDSDGGKQAAAEPVVTDSGVTEMPVEHSRFVGHRVRIGDYEGAWSYLRTQEDHFVDLSEVMPTRQLLRAWAATQVDLTTAQDVTLQLTAYGPADVWINDGHVFHRGATHVGAETVSFTVPFSEGRNAILIRFERVSLGACSFAVALRLVSARRGAPVAPPTSAAAVIPTTIVPVKRRRELEHTFDAARLNQLVFERFDRVSLQFDPVIGHWAAGFTMDLQTPDGQTYAEAEVGQRPVKADEATLGQAFSYPERFYHVVLVPPTVEYVNQQMWATRRLPFWGLGNCRYSDVAYGELVDRRFEALKQAAPYLDDVFAEMAKMALSWWSAVEQSVILRAIERVQARQEGSVCELLGLLGTLIRFGANPAFPEALRAPLEDAVLGYGYDHVEEDGIDVQREAEASSLLLHSCELLAGQHFADRIFSESGKTGAWHREQGQRLAMAWLRKRAAGGFVAWDSDVVFSEVIAALIHLVEFAEGDDVFDMATVMLDKTLFSLALNSFKGVFGSTRGLTETGQIFHGMLEATSGICRLMWGMGAFNSQTIGYVSLACAEEYGFPQLIQAIATDLPEGLWSRERHAPGLAGGEAEFRVDVVDKVTYRTPDYMLSSVQDYRPGEAGSREHVWRATLGPAATVFTNHPACSSFDVARRPNFWRGNAILPRVAQWQDSLIAIYALPEDDWMGFTHAYFPAYAFDAYALRDGWAFAQKDAGYIALTAARGFALLETGMHAGLELRSYGRRNIWLCQMGRVTQDGTFSQFQEAVLRQAPAFEDLSVRYTTLRGETLSFGWEGPLLRNGEVEPITGSRHYDSPYGVADLPAEEIVIMVGERALRLRLS